MAMASFKLASLVVAGGKTVVASTEVAPEAEPKSKNDKCRKKSDKVHENSKSGQKQQKYGLRWLRPRI
jgi:hypothetical protein